MKKNQRQYDPEAVWHYELHVIWKDGRQTFSSHSTNNEAEKTAITVLNASGNAKCGRVESIHINEKDGKCPSPNPHGI